MDKEKDYDQAPVERGRFGRDGISKPERSVLARSIVLEEMAPPSRIFSVTWIIACLVAAFLIWAFLITLDERAVARGEILPQSRVTPVQHLEGGIVQEIMVQDGQRVSKGHALIRLDPTAARAEYEGLQAREAALALQIARLKATAMAETPDFGAYATAFPTLYQDQLELYQSEISSLDALRAVADAQIQARREEVSGLKALEQSLSEQLAAIESRTEMRRQLVAKNIEAPAALRQLEQELARVRSELDQARIDRARAGGALAEAQGRKREAEANVRSDALEQLGQLSSDRAELIKRMQRLEDRLSRTEIKASVDGILTGLKLTAGSIISAGEVLAQLVPSDDMLRAEVRISPQDIGYIEVGQPVLLKIDTYSFARLGGVSGHVAQISSTSFRDENNQPYFEASISLDQSFVGRDPRANLITPGMTVIADIKTGEKTLMSYLWRPVSRSLSDSFGER